MFLQTLFSYSDVQMYMYVHTHAHTHTHLFVHPSREKHKWKKGLQSTHFSIPFLKQHTEGHTDTGVVFGAFLGLVPVVGPGNKEFEESWSLHFYLVDTNENESTMSTGPCLLGTCGTRMGHHQTSDTDSSLMWLMNFCTSNSLNADTENTALGRWPPASTCPTLLLSTTLVTGVPLLTVIWHVILI